MNISNVPCSWTPLDLLGPYRGNCAFCGHADARHRLGDAIMGRHRAGEPAEDLAHDYGIPVDALRQFIDITANNVILRPNDINP